MVNQQKCLALRNWLIAGAQPQTDFESTVAEVAKRLADAGTPLDLMSVYGFTINPINLGWMAYWTPNGGIKIATMSHEETKGPRWIGTGAEVCKRTRRIVRHRLGEAPELDDHPSAKALLARGYVEYILLPLSLTHVTTCVFAVGTKRAGGFDDEEFRALRGLQAPMARVLEAELLNTNTAAVLSAYVGRNAGEMVMHGRILRGDLENIPAVILFADLKGFTSISNVQPAEEVIAALNKFFDSLDGPIRGNGGEVLKLIGDGLLAIFPTPDDLTAQEAAAIAALSAVDDARAALAGSELDFRAALHVGDIQYGNIGSANRLDFTAIGPTVNLAARMLGAADDKGADTVCSIEFAALIPVRTEALGESFFKGFKEPQAMFRVT